MYHILLYQDKQHPLPLPNLPPEYFRFQEVFSVQDALLTCKKHKPDILLTSPMLQLHAISELATKMQLLHIHVPHLACECRQFTDDLVTLSIAQTLSLPPEALLNIEKQKGEADTRHPPRWLRLYQKLTCAHPSNASGE